MLIGLSFIQTPINEPSILRSTHDHEIYCEGNDFAAGLPISQKSEKRFESGRRCSEGGAHRPFLVRG